MGPRGFPHRVLLGLSLCVCVCVCVCVCGWEVRSRPRGWVGKCLSAVGLVYAPSRGSNWPMCWKNRPCCTLSPPPPPDPIISCKALPPADDLLIGRADDSPASDWLFPLVPYARPAALRAPPRTASRYSRQVGGAHKTSAANLATLPLDLGTFDHPRRLKNVSSDWRQIW